VHGVFRLGQLGHELGRFAFEYDMDLVLLFPKIDGIKQHMDKTR
jgi:hypothetical protein